MTCSFLIDKALMNIWAGPRQDTQSIVKPMRITQPNGAWNKVDVGRDTYVLPESGVRFHVYQIGQLYPILMGLFPIQDHWVTLAENCEKEKMMVNLYNNKGIELPRFDTWYLVTPDRNLLIAVKEHSTIDIDLKVEPIFMRVYSNAFFHGSRFNTQEHYIKVFGKKIKSNEDIVTLKDKYEEYRNPSLNIPILYINGRKANILNLYTVNRGDIVEFIVDTSIYRYVEFPIKSLKTFDSLRDLKRKYLLHYKTKAKPSDQLDYHDDIDFYIIRKDPEGVNPSYTGFYFHKNQEDAVRNVTHRDYSICVPYVTRYTEQDIPYYSEDNTLTGWYVQMYVRYSGWDRSLPSIHNRVKELYKLPDQNIFNALLGIDSQVPEWRADNLENSDYLSVMMSPDYNLDQTQVENAWGYNAVTKMTADTPMKVEMYSGRKVAHLPLLLRRDATGFEYDKNGVLIGWHPHLFGDRYICRHEETELVEMVNGIGSSSLDDNYNRPTIPYNKKLVYRLFKQEKDPISGLKEWVEAVKDVDYIFDESIGETGAYQWLLNYDDYNTICRSDRQMLVIEQEHFMGDGLIYFPLMYASTRGGVEDYYKLEIPMGELDVFLNGYSLVENVDYYVDYPNICIVNKKFLKDPNTETQKVLVRAYGMTEVREFQRNEKEEAGFVQYGTLSRNNRFDIRDDRVMRINVAGRLFHRDDLGFSEDNTEIRVEGVPNGAPYEIKDIIVQLRNVVTQDHKAYRERSLDLNNRISDYMTQFIKDAEKTTPDPIPEYWPVYSPFCVKVMSDLVNRVIDNKKIRDRYDDNYILSVTKPYQYLLKVDPTQEDTLYHDEFVKVHPTHLMTVVDVDPWQYKFMERLVKLMLHDRVDLSQFVRMRHTVES